MLIVGLLVVVALIALIAGPQYWIRRVMKLHAAPRADFPGTGGELAEHLIEEFGLDGVRVERIADGMPTGDHYDPEAKTVRLSADNYGQSSLTAVAVAAHEVGHALQHHDGNNGRGDGGLGLRQRLVGFAQKSDKLASIFFLAAPVLGVLVRTPAAFIALVGFGIALLAIRIAVHLVTLPVEFDASFRRALPILEEGKYLHEDDLPAARSVLKAAALTYVAGAIMSLIDLARWIRVLR